MAKLSEVFLEELEYNDIDELVKVEFENKQLTFNNCDNKDLKTWRM